MELKERTKLSSRTIAKHLSQMIKLQIVEKKTDVESGKYPVPVLYKAEPELESFIKITIARREFANKMEPLLNRTKDPLIFLDMIHAFSQAGFMQLLTLIQQDKSITNAQINFFEECALWANYKHFTLKLIEASRKIINNLNITQSLINQAKRQIIIYEKVLKTYEKSSAPT
jgi:hypothetical protein